VRRRRLLPRPLRTLLAAVAYPDAEMESE
jgi:hypothetical protein